MRAINRKQFVFFSIILFVFGGAHAQLYSYASIPDSLLNGADVVVRNRELLMTVKDKEVFFEKTQSVVTILKDCDAMYLNCQFMTDKYTQVTEFKGGVLDKAGKLVYAFSIENLQNFKPIKEFVNDNQYKVLSFPHLPYPYTVFYEVTIKHKGSLFYPIWIPQMSNREAVMRSVFKIETPESQMMRYKEVALPQTVKKASLQWTAENMKAYEEEAFSPDRELSCVITSPTNFVIDDYEGDMTSWEGFGNFMYRLNDKRTALPPKTQSMLKEMVADCPDTLCKVQRLYQYLQNHTRYFLVALGMGGWQTAAAADTDKLKYGDCKGLSYYMIAMLQSVGVDAYPILVYSGSQPFLQTPDFSNPYFNHQIVAVPLAHDTIWLECTSQTLACGYLLPSTENKSVLIVKEKGSKLVQTPVYDADYHVIQRGIEVSWDTLGGAVMKANNRYKGIFQERKVITMGQGQAAQQNEITDALGYADVLFTSIDYLRSQHYVPEISETIALSCPKLGSKTEKRWFIPIRFFTTPQQLPPPYPNRRQDVQVSEYNYSEIDSITIEIPVGMKIESMCEPLKISCFGGSFEVSSIVQGNKLRVYRRLTLHNVVANKEMYIQWSDFMKQVIKHYKGSIVLVKM